MTLVDATWRKTWKPLPRDGYIELTEGTRSGGTDNKIGTAIFSAGVYPACSQHGAVVAVGNDKWRCLAPGCNVGAEGHGHAHDRGGMLKTDQVPSCIKTKIIT